MLFRERRRDPPAPELRLGPRAEAGGPACRHDERLAPEPAHRGAGAVAGVHLHHGARRGCRERRPISPCSRPESIRPARRQPFRKNGCSCCARNCSASCWRPSRRAAAPSATTAMPTGKAASFRNSSRFTARRENPVRPAAARWSQPPWPGAHPPTVPAASAGITADGFGMHVF